MPMLTLVQGTSVWSRDAMFILQFYALDLRVLLSMCLTKFIILLKSIGDEGFRVSLAAGLK